MTDEQCACETVSGTYTHCDTCGHSISLHIDLRGSCFAEQTDASIHRMAGHTTESEAMRQALVELNKANAEIDRLEIALGIIGDRAVVDWDDTTVGLVDKAVPGGGKYAEVAKNLMAKAKRAEKAEAELDRLTGANETLVRVGMRAEKEINRLKQIKDENQKLRQLINEGGACCNCEVDGLGIEIEVCELHQELDRFEYLLLEEKEYNASLVGMIKSIEWSGYDAESGERACPNCEAWKYQPNRDRSIHAYACSLAVLIGAPMEEPDKEIFWCDGSS